MEPPAAPGGVASAALRVTGLTRRYGRRTAVDAVSFGVMRGEIFGLLGPNGGGKTSLFRVLSTLLEPDGGEVSLEGADLVGEPARVRSLLGVVFQSPSLDGKLRVRENLRHQGNLYGLRGAGLEKEIDRQLAHLGITGRANDTVETLSGGLKRRAEIAKALLHGPRFLLLDEPSTGLDPGARIDLWTTLQKLRREDGVTILLTTHLMEEAEKCDRVAIMHRGKIIALDTPGNLRASIGGDIVTIRGRNLDKLARRVADFLQASVSVVEGEIRIEQPDGHRIVGRLAGTFGDEIETITLGKPTLEDVFIQMTGHRLGVDENPDDVAAGNSHKK